MKTHPITFLQTLSDRIRNTERTRRRETSSRNTVFGCRNGNVATIFALAATILTVAVGGVIDLAQMRRLHSVMQAGADAAALSAARHLGTDETKRRSEADNVYLANVVDLPSPTVGTLTSSAPTYTYTATYAAPTTFLKIIGLDSLTLEARSQAVASTDTLDVALVLDSSGSMANGNRMVELKKAVKLFLGAFTTGTDVQVAMIPFDTEVRVDAVALTSATSAAPTNPYASTTDCNTLTDPIEKTACQTAQSTKPAIDCNAFVSSVPYRTTSQNRCLSSYASGFKLGTTGTFTDCVSWLLGLCTGTADLYYKTIDTGSAIVAQRQEWVCTQWLLLVCVGAGWSAPVTLESRPYTPSPAQTPQTAKTATDETANSNLLLQPADVWSGCLIDRTQPYDVQNTAPIAGLPATLYPKANCTVGTLIPLKGLTNNLTSLATTVDTMQPSGATNITIGVQWGMEALTANAPLTGTTGGSRKFMIVMTDGANTQDRWYGNGTANSPDRDKIDARTRLACANAKTAGITIYAINLVDGDPTLLTYCASDTAKFFNVTTASQLSDVFAQIANSIKRIRISS
jgi:Flp pilus assembly protein TadG